MKKKRTRVPSPFPEAACWRVDGEVAGEFRLRSKEDLRRLQSITALTVAPEMLDQTMERALRSTLFEEGAGDQQWTVDMYSRALHALWQWMHRLTLEAANPNIKRSAGRALGELYHEAAHGKMQEQLCRGNDEFKDQVAPFNRRHGGPRPSPELMRWVDHEMSQLQMCWLKALEVASRAGDDPAALARHWSTFFKREQFFATRHHLRNDLAEMLKDHRFTRLEFAVLSDFKRLWRAALHDDLRDRWQTQKKAKELRIPGKGSDHSFVKRFGDLKNDRQAGYHLVERFWRRFWEPAMKQCFHNHAELKAALLRDLGEAEKQVCPAPQVLGG